MKRLIVAIDGPAGAGKSTVGRLLAGRLGYRYIDTGAMYRAMALKACRMGVDFTDAEALGTCSRATTIALCGDLTHPRVILDGEDVSSEIRTQRMSELASKVSTYREVRDALLSKQRDLGREGGVVLDGRDIGTVVFPEADVKFFLDAAVEERSARRFRELVEQGESAELEDVRRKMRERDAQDSNRECAPLQKAPDAIVVDSTALSPEGVVDRMERHIEALFRV